jgi:hypothetical protein
MKRYCISCGGPTEYSIKKPIFCSNCGASFEPNTEKVIEKVQIKKPIIAKKIYIEEPELDNDINYDDDQDVNEVPNISKLQVETQSDQVVRGVKLKDLMGTSGSENSKKERRKEKAKKVSKKQVLEDFAKEASSLRRSKK